MELLMERERAAGLLGAKETGLQMFVSPSLERAASVRVVWFACGPILLEPPQVHGEERGVVWTTRLPNCV